MLDHVIRFSIRHRGLVLLLAVAVTVIGGYQALHLPVDVFPDLNRPTVTVLTEAPGLAPEEVEVLVTRPLEYLLNGATGVRRVRSSSAAGLSVISVEFDWGSDVYRGRQIVTEKLQMVRERLPRDAHSVLAPVSSIMGEILLIGLRPTDPTASPEVRERRAMERRTFAEFTLRNRLLAVEGVAQVNVLGGTLQQFQVIATPAHLRTNRVTLDELVDATEKATALVGGGVMSRGPRESPVRVAAQALTTDDIAGTVAVWREPRPLRIGEVAEVRLGGPVKRGDAAVRIREEDGPTPAVSGAVVAIVQKQPHADTLTLDRAVDSALDELEAELPPETKLERHVFRQADFIRAAVGNVEEAIRDGIFWVFIVLFLFLWNVRTSFITLTAIPLSVLLTALFFHAAGVSLNTMTLGGIAVAVGELVDDAIVDVENIHRRLKQWRAGGGVGDALEVVFAASSEVRNAIVYATLIVCLVVVPLFFLPGVEGRLFAPLGLAYIVALAASLLVSLTVTPALAAVLLPGARFLERPGDPLLLRFLKWIDGYLVRFSLRHPRKVLIVVAVLSLLSVLSVLGMGGDFLPEFNEGTLTINLESPPGTSLGESNRIGERAEATLLAVSEVLSVTRRTGRAEMDEHAEGVHASEVEVRLAEHGRPRSEVIAEVRDRLSRLPGVGVNVGQPISHRIDHMVSGVRAQLAIKVFGPDLRVLRETAADIARRVHHVEGVTDLRTEPQVEVSQVRLEVDREALATFGLRPGDVARTLETALKGRVVGQIVDGEKTFDVVVWLDEATRNDPVALRSIVLPTPSGRPAALDELVRVLEVTGPNVVNRENGRRRIVVSCNVENRDLASVVADVRRELAPVQTRLTQLGGYRLELGGQFEAQQEANRLLLLLGIAALGGVFLLLWQALGSWWAALQVLVNVPLAAVGSVIALLLVNRPDQATLAVTSWQQWPALWLAATSLTVAHAVGFITLTGIVSRNGILMISHYLHLMRVEGEPFGEAMIVRGTLERLAPVLMTASVAVIGLVPLALGAGQPGKEILYPLAVVVIGGLVVSTLLDQVVTPALFFLGRH